MVRAAGSCLRALKADMNPLERCVMIRRMLMIHNSGWQAAQRVKKGVRAAVLDAETQAWQHKHSTSSA
jgi:hypothetical protein